MSAGEGDRTLMSIAGQGILSGTPTGKETPNHGLSSQGSVTNTQEISGQTLQMPIQHIAGFIAPVLRDGQILLCWRLQTDQDWRVRHTPTRPNNPALGEGDVQRTTPPLSAPISSGFVREDR